MSRRRLIRKKGVIADAQRLRISDTGSRLIFRSDPWTRKLVRPLIITLLATSFAIALLVIVRILSPEQPWMAIVPLVFLIALEGAYTTAWLNNPDSNGVDRFIYRVAEVILILIIARVYSWIVFGGGIPTPEEMRLYLTQPLSLFSIAGFVTTSLVSLVAWQLAVSISRTFSKLDISAYEIGFYTQPQAVQKAQGDDRPIQISREVLQTQFLNTWITFGMAMVIIAALSTYEVGQLASVSNPFDISRLGLSPAMLFALMVYFLAGFWLLSHSRQMRLNAHWLLDGFAKEASLERSWHRNALIVLIIIAFLAAFLPIGSTLGISRILNLGLTGIAYLAGIIFAWFGRFISRAFQLFVGEVDELAPEPLPVTPQPPLEPPTLAPGNPDSLATLVISSAFWTLFIAIILASIAFFLRERGYRFDRIQLQAMVNRLKSNGGDVWRRIWGNLRSMTRRLRTGLTETASRVVSQADSGVNRPRFIRLNALPPREQVRYYYLALVRRATERGVPRRESETPLEFVEDLREHWPNAEDELNEITRAFMEARYSPQPIDKTDAISIKKIWNDLKVNLRQRK